MFIVTSKQMYQVECNAVKRSLSFPRLMENAGAACARIIRERCKIDEDHPKNIMIICGKGRNGGDGFVIARKLSEIGCPVTVALVCGEPAAREAYDMFRMLDNIGVEIIVYTGAIPPIKAYIDKADILIDCVFGTGFNGALDISRAALAIEINESKAYTVAIDVPSGANCDSAKITGEAIKADMTIAISALKPIHVMKPSCEYCGETVVADIGIIPDDYRALDSLVCFTCNDADIKKLLPRRISVSNKGTYGHALCICGSYLMQGAAALSVNAALRCGVGLVTAAFPSTAYAAIAPKLTEALMLPMEAGLDGTFAFTAYPKLLEASARVNSVLLGCGIGFNADTERLVLSFMRECKKPMIIDADGINVVAANIDILKEVRVPVIMTPHPGEMSRLCGKSTAEIVQNPIQTAIEFAVEHNVIVVLKGANTVVCSPDPINVYINTSGNSGLSKGGSGDLLAGMMASLLAQSMEPFDAAVAAVYLHGKCADITANRLSQRGMLPSDLLCDLPGLLSKFE